ncbi:hypothetical protein M9H77_30534 [Catharanthus roseus]|uniref:Uncharacterized protein n=1 Tax=Catharanthus roseus TaxID=4058 RepID=A0ACB9ZYU0_CATRO|nr:hypothetical protein M9H77_30534 [Catharanthus roseus]
MSAYNPYPFHEVGFQGRPQAIGVRREGQGGRRYYRPHEEVPRQEPCLEDDLFEDFEEDPNIGKINHGGYYSNQQEDRTLDKIKWKVLSLKGENDDCQDDLIEKEEGNEDQEIDSFEAIEEGMSLVTIRALSTQILQEESKKKKSIEEGKGVDERKVSVENPREEKMNREKKMKERCFYAKESEIIEAIKKEEMVLLLYCKGTFVEIIEENKDVFPEKVHGGLLPLRGIEHQIDLVPGVVLPNRPAPQSFPVEIKELRRQVEELVSKGSSKAKQEAWKMDGVYWNFSIHYPIQER